MNPVDKDKYISLLSDLRCQFNCFDEVEEPFYRALSDAIKVMNAEPCDDAISRKAAIAECNKEGAYGYISAEELAKLPSVKLR